MTWPRWPWGQQGGTANGVQTKGVHPAAGSQAAGLQGQPPHRPTPGPPSTNSRGEQARMGLAYGSSSSGSTSSIWSSYGDKGRSCRMSRCYRPSGTKRKKCPTLTAGCLQALPLVLPPHSQRHQSCPTGPAPAGIRGSLQPLQPALQHSVQVSHPLPHPLLPVAAAAASKTRAQCRGTYLQTPLACHMAAVPMVMMGRQP